MPRLLVYQILLLDDPFSAGAGINLLGPKPGIGRFLPLGFPFRNHGMILTRHDVNSKSNSLYYGFNFIKKFLLVFNCFIVSLHVSKY